MARRKISGGLSKFVMNLAVFAFTGVGLLFKLFSQFGLETRQAGKGLIKIFCLLLVLGIFISSIWFCLLMMLYLYLIGLQYTPYFSLLMIILLNGLAIVVVMLLINQIRKKYFYPEIRKGLQQVKNSFK